MPIRSRVLIREAYSLLMHQRHVDVASVDTEEEAVEYKGAYLLISNRYDAPKKVLAAWLRRWNIENTLAAQFGDTMVLHS